MGIKGKVIDLVRDKRTQLPTLPVVLTNILQIASDESASASDLAVFISRDQAIANKVLRLANSAYYGLARKVDSIQRAIAIIGFNEIVSLAVGMGVFSTLSNRRADGLLSMRELWLHSIGCSFAAKQVVTRVRAARTAGPGLQALRQARGEELFLSGLLHDIGKVIFAIYFPQEYSVVLEAAEAERAPLQDKEHALLGLDHAEMAGLIMERWNFPEALQLPALYHHRPEACPEPYSSFAMVVAVANCLCHHAAIGHSGNPVMPDADPAYTYLGFAASDRAALLDQLKQQQPAIEQFLTVIA
jgi:HD-like signal output (HDOD) protein